MSNIYFLKRIFTSKIYWLSVIAAIFLLLCSIVYYDSLTGEKYTFVSLFYDNTVQEALEYCEISLESIMLGYDTSYLWMFCPIIVGIPCVLINKTERFVLFRIGKNKYVLSKFFSNLFASGSILMIAYVVYVVTGMMLMKEYIWDMLIIRKLISVFVLGVISAVPGVVLSEFVHNKYLILCIPFVLNYFMYTFLGNIVSYDIRKYIEPATYQILFLNDEKMIIPCVGNLIFLIAGCVFLMKFAMKRRCDCGQK